MKINRKLLITAGLIAIMSINSVTYAAISNVPAASKSVDKDMSMFAIYDRGIDVDGKLDLKKLLEKDLSVQATTKGPQILIIHSHPHEEYAGDRKGSVLDVGYELERLLEEEYKVSVLHYKNSENLNKSAVGAYDRIEGVVKQLLKENPSIEVIIDIHRDGGPEPTTKMINKKPTAKINIINGLSIDEKIGQIGSLKEYPNPYIQDNLSFSVQMKEKSDELAPELIPSVILKQFRYSLHMAPKSLLVDIGNNEDTLEAALNAVEPFADSLASVLGLEKLK